MAEAEATSDSVSALGSASVDYVVVSGLIENGTHYGGQALTAVSKAVALRGLDRLAARKTLLNTQDVREVGAAATVSISLLILRMLEACEITSNGQVWVICAPSDQGKTCAAEFMMHGEHGLRPDRSLKNDATNWNDFRANCATEALHCPQLANLSVHLCQSLFSREPLDVDASDPTFIEKVSDWPGRLSCVTSDNKVKFDEKHPIKIFGPRSREVCEVGAVACKPSPILIIDDFNEDTAKNVEFVKELYRDTAKAKIVVFSLQGIESGQPS